MSSNPGILSRVFNTLDANTTAFGVITHDQTVPLKVRLLIPRDTSPSKLLSALPNIR